jgi:hypothetical protein
MNLVTTKRIPTAKAVLEMLEGCPDGATTAALACHFEQPRLAKVLAGLAKDGLAAARVERVVTLGNDKMITVFRWRIAKQEN